MRTPRRVVIAVFPGVDLLDVSGPAEVFARADREAGGSGRYQVLLAGPARGPVTTSAGVRILADAAFAEVDGAVDTLLVPGAVDTGPDGPVPRIDREVVEWVKEAAPNARRVASVDVGAHLLAAAGLLDDRTATDHAAAARAAAEPPERALDPAPVAVRSGNVRAGAGISTGTDLALALVAEDLGGEAALAVARRLAVRPGARGGQSRFPVPPSAPPRARRDIDGVRRYITEHLGADLSTAALAERTGLSGRHFARVFRQETGSGPAAYVESVRVEAARRLLESTDLPLERVAADCGLGSVGALRRALHRRTGTGPTAYRRHFRTSA